MSTSDSVSISRSLPQSSQADIDAALERLIHTAYLASIDTRDPEIQRAGCDALADEFMRRLYTGEGLNRTDVEYVLRQSFIRDAQRTTKLPAATKMKMVIKGWNWRQRGMEQASYQTVAVQANDDQRIRIY